MADRRPQSGSSWEPMEFWEFICGRCGEGLFMEGAPEGDALIGRCRNRDCAHQGVVVKVYPPGRRAE